MLVNLFDTKKKIYTNNTQVIIKRFFTEDKLRTKENECPSG